jgi:hypothetical protein
MCKTRGKTPTTSKNTEFDPQELPEDDGQEEGTVPELDEDGLGGGE